MPSLSVRTDAVTAAVQWLLIFTELKLIPMRSLLCAEKCGESLERANRFLKIIF